MMSSQRKPIATLAVASALLFFGGSAQANTVTSNNGAATASLTIQSDWGSGYCASVSISNQGNAAINSWQVVINPNNSTINNLWNGNLANNIITNMSYNNHIGIGGHTAFGFC